jgi:hypothetical protein
MNEQLAAIIASLAEAIKNGRTITIKADEITINADDMSATSLEFTVE